jgi:hypothetical protein
MSIDDESGFGGESLEHVLHQLLEAQVRQTGLMTELVSVSKSLARSESRESIAEYIAAVAESTRTEMLAALVESNRPMAATATPTAPPVAQSTVSDDVVNVLAQYDGLRAALARDDAANFYVAATAENSASSRSLTIEGTATKKADRVTIGGKCIDAWSRPFENTILVTDPPEEVFTAQPAVELWAGLRLIGAARSIKVKSSSSTTY